MTNLFARQERSFAIARQAHEIALAQFPAGRVEPEAIAQRAGLRFRYAHFDEDFDGILMLEGGEFFLVCNERHARRGTPRSRFTFAHELGHFFLPDHREALLSGRIATHFSLAEFMSRQPIERDADWFATNLLMPYGPFLREAEAMAGGAGALDKILHLAEVFGTSVTSTAFRVLDANLLAPPAAVLRWNRSGELVARRLSDDTYWEAHWRQDFHVLAEPPPPGSATHLLMRDHRGERRAGRLDSLEWFPNLLSPKHPRNLPLCEEALSLGRYGYLTVLSGEDPSAWGTWTGAES